MALSQEQEPRLSCVRVARAPTAVHSAWQTLHWDWCVRAVQIS